MAKKIEKKSKKKSEIVDGRELRRIADVEEYRNRRAALQSENKVVLRPIARVGNNVLRSNSGRKKKFTPARMRNAINRYFQSCEDKDTVPSIKAMMISMGMLKDQFYKYLTYPEFTDMMEHARMIMRDWIEEDIYRTPGQAAGKLAYAKNLHGWAEKVETKNESTQVTISVSEARSKIQSLAPKLLEVLSRSPEIVKQLSDNGSVDAELIEESK